VTLGASALNATSPEEAFTNLSKALIHGICTTAQNSCTGANKVYASYESCFNFLTSGTIPLGQAYQAGRNTILCRMIHEPMVEFRPDVHCPHIGPTGGIMCADDFTYVQKVEGPSSFFTNAPWLPRFAGAAANLTSRGGPLVGNGQLVQVFG
jgi:hypothetical protein